MKPALLLVVSVAALAATASAWSVRAAGPAAASFTQAQADQGQDLYIANCASCHGAQLNDGQFAPSLKGQAFRTKWRGKSVGEFFTYVSANMPPGQAGVLAPEDYADLSAFLLQSNGAKAGTAALPSDPKGLTDLAWPAPNYGCLARWAR